MPTPMPIVKVKLPSVLSQYENGRVPESQLDTVESTRTALVWKMAILPARGMRALHAEAKKHGIILSSTGRGRTYTQQEQLFRTRYTTTYLPGRPYKIWNGVRWYQKPGVAMAAVPGTSNHGWWCADDLAEVVGGVTMGLRASTVEWLFNNAGRFGFAWETTSENWHVHWIAGDTVPQAVLAYEDSLNPPPPPPNPIPPTEDDEMPILVRFQKYANVFTFSPGGGYQLLTASTYPAYASLQKVLIQGAPDSSAAADVKASWNAAIKAALNQNGLTQADLLSGGSYEVF